MAVITHTGMTLLWGFTVHTTPLDIILELQ